MSEVSLTFQGKSYQELTMYGIELTYTTIRNPDGSRGPGSCFYTPTTFTREIGPTDDALSGWFESDTTEDLSVQAVGKAWTFSGARPIHREVQTREGHRFEMCTFAGKWDRTV